MPFEEIWDQKKLDLTEDEKKIIDALDKAVSLHYKLPILDSEERKDFERTIKQLRNSILSRPQRSYLLYQGTGYFYEH